MLESILAEIDAEIVRLRKVKDLLSSGDGVATDRKPGRPTYAAVAAPAKAVKRRTLSAEARERIRQAQIRRWAAAKQPAKPKPNLNATVAPLPKAKKKAAKSAA